MKRLNSQGTPMMAGLMFLAVLLVGGMALTVANRSASIHDVASPDVTDEGISPRQAAAIEAQRATSNLLFNLAFASLGALIGLRFSDKTAARLTGSVPVVASALLGLSLYAAHLLNSNIDYALTHGPIRLISGHATQVPMAAQFWLFAAAVLMLAWWALSTRIAGVMVLVLSASSGVVTASVDSVQNRKELEACTTQWSEARKVALPEVARASSVALTQGVLERTKTVLNPDQTCAFVFSTLDLVRREALDARIGETGLPDWMRRELVSLDAQLKTPNIAPGEFLERLLAASAIWRSPSGLLAVRSRIGIVQILATLQSAGRDWRNYTDCEMRLPPGKYTLRFVRDGKRAAPDRLIDVIADQRTEVVVDREP